MAVESLRETLPQGIKDILPKEITGESFFTSGVGREFVDSVLTPPITSFETDKIYDIMAKAGKCSAAIVPSNERARASMRGYLDNPDATSNQIKGDVGKLQEHLTPLLDRMDEWSRDQDRSSWDRGRSGKRYPEVKAQIKVAALARRIPGFIEKVIARDPGIQ